MHPMGRQWRTACLEHHPVAAIDAILPQPIVARRKVTREKH